MPALVVNGQPTDVPDALSVADLLRHLGRDPDQPGVAVAVADRVVRRSEWATTAVADGAHVEIVTAAQGG